MWILHGTCFGQSFHACFFFCVILHEFLTIPTSYREGNRRRESYEFSYVSWEKGKTGRKKEDIFICFCLSTYLLSLPLKWERRWVWSMRRTMSKIFLIPKISRKIFLQTVRFSCVWASAHIHFYKRTVKRENPGAGRKFSKSLCIGIWLKLKMQFDIFKVIWILGWKHCKLKKFYRWILKPSIHFYLQIYLGWL